MHKTVIARADPDSGTREPQAPKAPIFEETVVTAANIEDAPKHLES